MTKDIQFLEKKANWIRNKVLDMIVDANKGHIGGAYSSADILTSIYYSGLFQFNPNNPLDDNRTRFILSKGHSCVALYVILADLGYFPLSELETFCKNNSRLGGHPDRHIPGIEVDTGSLGQGLGIGSGIALAAKLDKKPFKTMVLMGDGECGEGSVWEAVMFAGHHKLNNLIVVIDYNKQFATDFADDSINLEPFANKWCAFNWDFRIVGGHSFEELYYAFNSIVKKQDKPTVIIANTIKGKGISYMERELKFHHTVPNLEQTTIAKRELSVDN